MIIVQIEEGDTIVADNSESPNNEAGRADCAIISVRDKKLVVTLGSGGNCRHFLVDGGKVAEGTIKDGIIDIL